MSPWQIASCSARDGVSFCRTAHAVLLIRNQDRYLVACGRWMSMSLSLSIYIYIYMERERYTHRYRYRYIDICMYTTTTTTNDNNTNDYTTTNNNSSDDNNNCNKILKRY